MNAEKEPCGLDITLDDIRKIENQYDVTIRIHFDKLARAWCFDFEKGVFIDRLVLCVTFLRETSKSKLLDIFANRASSFAK